MANETRAPFRWDWVIFWAVSMPAVLLTFWGGYWCLVAPWVMYSLGRWDAEYGQKWRP